MAGRNILLSEQQFLEVADRSAQIGGSTITSVEWEEDKFWFRTEGISGSYTVIVQLVGLDFDAMLLAATPEIETMLRESDLKVYCDCPAFGYWGFKYIATQGEFGLEEEGRSPDIRNPDQRGYVCKHLYAVLDKWPQVMGEVVTDFKRALVQKVGMEEFVHRPEVPDPIMDEFLERVLERIEKTLLKII